MHHKTRFTPEKIAQRLKLIEPLVYRARQPLSPFRYHELSDPSAPFHLISSAPSLSTDWPEIPPHTYWGKWQTNFLLTTTFTVDSVNQQISNQPPNQPTNQPINQTPIALYLPLGDSGDFSHPECLAYLDGQPYATCDRHHQEILLQPEHCIGTHTLTLHGWTGLGGWHLSGLQTQLYMRPCEIVQIDEPTRALTILTRVALETVKNLGEDDPVRYHLQNALEEAFIVLDTRDPLGGEPFYTSVEPALALLQTCLAKAGAPLNAIIHATGHAHIDVAWLWTLGQTRQKAARTFTNVLRLMEQFPDYHFTQSQPQLYHYLQQDYPALFDAIRQRIAEKRWEPIGGMWVEADCNLSGPESLARQFILGRTYFREHFGPDAESPVLWLPDVFGYAWALPQLIQQAGLKYFMTIKIGWSQYNRLPYDTFYWQGLDGTKILTHFSTVKEFGSPYASTYNSMANPSEALGTWQTFQQKELHPDLLMAYGYGDGGGGPTREMLENIEIMGHFPGLPQVKQSSAKAFFEAVEAATLEPALTSRRMPTWNGELYLEYHRGTYTTQSRNKRANRKAEFLLHDTEFLATYASLLTQIPSPLPDSQFPIPDYQYPAAEFQKAWQTVCLNQFHDIIPGSSIGEVYVESLAQYAELTRTVTALRDTALQTIADHMKADVILVNPTSFPQPGLVFVPDLSSRFTRGTWSRKGESGGKLSSIDKTESVPAALAPAALPEQPTASGKWIDAGELPPYSVTPLTRIPSGTDETSTPIRKGERAGNVSPIDKADPHPGSLAPAPTILENPLLLAEFNADGDLVRLYDKTAHREILAPSAIANQFQAFEDRPKNWDAWDIDIFYDDKTYLADPATSIHWLETGPLRQTLEIKRRILHSEYTQRITLTHNSSRLDFDTWINWTERHIVLKVAFPVDILAPQATYEIQWGNVQRPTHRNSSWDWARFETCAQKWADLSEGDYGVSLLNDCKYGHDIRNNTLHCSTIRLTLLRSPTSPDPTADLGEHRFTYSLYPHTGSWDERTIAAAYNLNDPVIVWMTEDGKPKTETSPPPVFRLPSLVSLDSPNVVLETLKRAEDGNGLILRLYESQRKRGPVTLTTAFPIQSAWITNLLEENGEPIRVELTLDGNQLHLNIRPYQILTLRLLPA
ncbi:MAG: alpha-mannosidase [Anaerolineales bacterium]|nr:alpha-mannosidase [Anaerolineales bacterium]